MQSPAQYAHALHTLGQNRLHRSHLHPLTGKFSILRQFNQSGPVRDRMADSRDHGPLKDMGHGADSSHISARHDKNRDPRLLGRSYTMQAQNPVYSHIDRFVSTPRDVHSSSYQRLQSIEDKKPGETENTEKSSEHGCKISKGGASNPPSIKRNPEDTVNIAEDVNQEKTPKNLASAGPNIPTDDTEIKGPSEKISRSVPMVIKSTSTSPLSSRPDSPSSEGPSLKRREIADDNINSQEQCNVSKRARSMGPSGSADAFIHHLSSFLFPRPPEAKAPSTTSPPTQPTETRESTLSPQSPLRIDINTSQTQSHQISLSDATKRIIIQMHEDDYAPLDIQRVFASSRKQHLDVTTIQNVISDGHKIPVASSGRIAPIKTAQAPVVKSISDPSLTSRSSSKSPTTDTTVSPTSFSLPAVITSESPIVDSASSRPPSPAPIREVLSIGHLSPEQRLETLIHLQSQLPHIIEHERQQLTKENARKEQTSAKLMKDIIDCENRVRAMKDELRTLHKGDPYFSFPFSPPNKPGASLTSVGLSLVVEEVNGALPEEPVVQDMKVDHLTSIDEGRGSDGPEAKFDSSDREPMEIYPLASMRNKESPHYHGENFGLSNEIQEMDTDSNWTKDNQRQESPETPINAETRCNRSRRVKFLKADPEPIKGNALVFRRTFTTRIGPNNHHNVLAEGLSPSATDDVESDTRDRTAPSTQRFRIKEPVHYTPYAKKCLSTMLLTNSYPDWSHVCICLSDDGNIEPLDCTTHQLKLSGFVSAANWTASCAINGAWIGPGELALVHKDPRMNWEKNQITTIKWSDPNMRIRPQINVMKRSPHENTRISAIASVEVSSGKRTFATGGMDGNLYLWKLDPDSAIVSQTAIHKKFIAQVSAITYRPSKRWLLSASRGRFLMTDLNTLESAGLVAYTQITSELISSISPRPNDDNLTMLSTRDKTSPLHLLDHRVKQNKSVVEVFSYPVAYGAKYDVPWNHSGTWNPEHNNYYVLGVHIWDIRMPKIAVCSLDLDLGNSLILSTRFASGELLAMSRRQLAWVKLEQINGF